MNTNLILKFLIVSTIFSPIYRLGAQNYPALETIIRTFYEKYDPEWGYDKIIQFARKPAGWSVIRINRELSLPKELDEQLFWSLDEGSYRQIDFPPYTGEKRALDHFVNNYFRDVTYTSYGYERCQYFGYAGWIRDMIQTFDHVENPPDTLLEGLARAYNEMATAIFRNPYGYELENEDWGGKDSAVSDKQVEAFLYNKNKGLETYKRLLDQNPEYETLVGNVFIKYSNEHVFAFELLASVGKDSLALSFMKPGLYHPFDLNFGYNLLSSCEPHAILFTNGDNDTFLAHYLQYGRGYRKDVRVICLTYLNADWFIYLLGKSWIESPRLPFSLPEKYWKGSEKQIKYVGEKKSIDLTLPTHKERLLKDGIVNSSELEGITGDSLTLEISTRGGVRRYFELKDTVLIHLIDEVAKDEWQRPIYFAVTADPSHFMGLDNFLRQEGIALRLLPVRNEGLKNEMLILKYGLAEGRSLDLVSQAFRFSTFDTTAIPSEGFRLAGIYSHLFQYLAYTHLERSKAVESDQEKTAHFEKAKEIVELQLEKMPYGKFPYNSFDLFRLGILMEELGMEASMTYMDYAQNQIYALWELPREKRVKHFEYSRSLDMLKYFAYYMRSKNHYEKAELIENRIAKFRAMQ